MTTEPTPSLTARHAADWARVAVQVLQTPYPYAPGHVATGPDDTDVTPQRLHPAFHGALDWHSSVHMQASLLMLVRDHREALAAAGVLEPAEELLAQRWRPEHVAAEVAYLRERPGFERPYGWAWAAVLAARAGEPLAPLADVVADHVLAWLPRQAYPVRHGKHQNDAFALRLLLHAFTVLGRDDVVTAVGDRALEWFGTLTDRDTRDEPGGSDFLSPALTEAALMGAVLEPEPYAAWLAAFLPGLGAGRHLHLLEPPEVRDPGDGQLVHLHGLSLSRAWQLRALAPHLTTGAAEVVLDAAARLVDSALPQTTGGDFMATHWLVSFALLAEDGLSGDAAAGP